MIVLGVESSCDETSVAIVKDGKEVLSNVVLSQIDIHEKFGGVVPEIASRHHVVSITAVFDEALKKANITPWDLDLVAVTEGPGLVGSLLVGINAAKAFAYANNLPIIGVNHLAGHIYANNIENEMQFPLIALLVSGGHTELIYMEDHFEFKVLGTTLDDAVGEAYDKVARVMGLPYPGGPAVDKLAHQGLDTYNLPRVYVDKDTYEFSFSGLKSAVINTVHNAMQREERIINENLACSFQESVTDVLVNKTIRACMEYNVKHIITAGGVAANKGLREKMNHEAKKRKIEVSMPSIKYCTDNAAMIAAAGYFQFLKEQKTRDLDINAIPYLDL